MQSAKKEEVSQHNSYVDGIPVKISEKYRQPRRVVLPMSCQNCFPVAIVDDEYDFTLENNTIKKLAEWKKSRQEEVDRRKERLKMKMKVCPVIEPFTKLIVDHTQVPEVEQTTQILNPVLSDSILTPICAKQNFPSPIPTSSRFNLSDFESDNSSPFDNMELKTINDMEILASILANDNSKTSLNINNNIVDKELGKNGLVINKGHNDCEEMPLNGYYSYVYSSPDCNYPVYSPNQSDLEQYHLGPVSEYNNITYNHALNDFSNQFGAAVSSESASTSTSSGCKEGPHIESALKSASSKKKDAKK